MLLTPRRKRTNRKLKPLNGIHIDAEAIHHNFELLQSLQPTHHILPVLKSNAYGHGTQQIASILRNCQTPLICVDSYPEAQLVRKFSKKEVLMMGETHPENYSQYKYTRLHVAVWSDRMVEALIQTGKPWKIHLFLNTGMHREGIQLQDLHSLLSKIEKSSLQLVGVMSHFANADEGEASFDQIQIKQFDLGVQAVRDVGFDPEYIHHNNTAGTIRHSDELFTASRVGLGVFGWSPFAHNDENGEALKGFTPALSVLSTVTAIQNLQAGDSVSYGHKWTSLQKTKVAVIPFGYTEGLRRSLRGERKVRRKDKYFPVVGTICMNLCCIDIGDADVKLGDRVEVISNQKNAPNSVSRFAELDNTIVYEVLVNLDSFVRRVVV